MLTYRGAVMTWECDSNGHMNIMYFINKYENGGRNLFVQVGMHLDYMTKHNYGVAVIEQQVKYLPIYLVNRASFSHSSFSRSVWNSSGKIGSMFGALP